MNCGFKVFRKEVFKDAGLCQEIEQNKTIEEKINDLRGSLLKDELSIKQVIKILEKIFNIADLREKLSEEYDMDYDVSNFETLIKTWLSDKDNKSWIKIFQEK